MSRMQLQTAPGRQLIKCSPNPYNYRNISLQETISFLNALHVVPGKEI